jgi:hypothetical protein
MSRLRYLGSRYPVQFYPSFRFARGHQRCAVEFPTHPRRLLWPASISILAIGYTLFERSAFSLDRKLNLAYYRDTPLGRLLIQDSLKCCGFYDALPDALPSKCCYSRTSLPGCKGILFRFERKNLLLIWSATFSIVPLHIVNMAKALLTANHMTNTFGKGRGIDSGMDVRRNAERLFGPVARLDMS